MLLDRRHDPPLLVQRRQRQSMLAEVLRRDSTRRDRCPVAHAARRRRRAVVCRSPRSESRNYRSSDRYRREHQRRSRAANEAREHRPARLVASAHATSTIAVGSRNGRGSSSSADRSRSSRLERSSAESSSTRATSPGVRRLARILLTATRPAIDSNEPHRRQITSMSDARPSRAATRSRDEHLVELVEQRRRGRRRRPAAAFPSPPASTNGV